MMSDNPQWGVMHVGTPLSTMQAAGFPTPSIIAPYYPDGLPCGRHTYFNAHYSSIHNKTFVAGDYAAAAVQWIPPFKGGPQMDVFDHATGTWAPQGTYPNVPISLPDVWSVCMDPRNGDIFATYKRVFCRYSQEDGIWYTFTPTVLTSDQQHVWYRSSFVDTARNEIVYHFGFSSGALGRGLAFVSIPTDPAGTYVGRTVPITDALYVNQPYEYSTLIKNEDSGKYERIASQTSLTATVPVVEIDPDTGTCAQLGANIRAPVNGCLNRYTYMDVIGGIAYLPGPLGGIPNYHSADLYFRPTR
jgi:hypothetical protein